MFQIQKNLQLLNTSVEKVNTTFDIASFFKPDEDIAISLIESKSPKFSKSDLEITIKGEISPQTEAAENLKNTVKEAAIGTATSIAQSGLSTTLSASTAALSNNLPNNLVSQQISSSTNNFNSAVSTTQQLTNDLTTSIGTSTPNANSLIDSTANSLESLTKDSLEKKNAEGAKPVEPKVGPSEVVNEDINPNNVESKKKAAKLGKEKKVTPLPKDHPIFKEVEKIKESVKKSVNHIFKEQKGLAQDLIKTSIQAANSISAAATLIAPLSFNLPGAISLIILVVDMISKVIDRALNIVLSSDPLQFLPLLLPEDQIDSITAPINAAILALISIIESTSFLQKLMNKLMALFMSASSPQNLSGQIDSLEEQIEQKKEELAKLIKKRAIQRKIDNKRKEIAELEERLRLMKKGPNLPRMNPDGNFEEKPIKDLFPDLQNQIQTVTLANDQLQSFIYDVYLPDGSVLSNIDEQRLKQLKSKYNIIFDNQNSI